MLEKIKQLEKTSRLLEPDASLRQDLQQKVLKYTEKFLNDLASAPAYVKSEEKGKGLYNAPIGENTIDIDDTLELFEQQVVTPGVNPASPGYVAYIPGGGIFHSALGDYLAAITNRYAGVFFASPGAVRMENMLLRWLSKQLGYPQTAAGNLTSGGSIANLIGIVTAREAYNLKAKNFEKTVIYSTDQVHHAVDKGIRVAGLKECQRRLIPIDENYRLRLDVLEDALAKDKKAGLNPWLIVASAGTANTGTIDPLETIAELASQYNLWFHVDGAYGGLFALCQEGKKVLKGMEQSHSLVVDPHKGLFLPFGTGAILVKDGQTLYQAHNYKADYMQDVDTCDELSPGDLSPEFSKHFRGLRLWLPLKLLGVAPFCAALEEKMWLARYFYEKLQKIDGFELGPYPELSLVTFRYIPPQGDINEFNQKLIREVQLDGRVFITSTTVGGKFLLRLAVLCFRTHLDTVEKTIEILCEKVKKILST